MIKIYLNFYNKNNITSLSLIPIDTSVTYFFKDIDELILYLKSILRVNNDVKISLNKDANIPNNHFSFSNKELTIKKSLKNTLEKHSNFLNEIFTI